MRTFTINRKWVKPGSIGLIAIGIAACFDNYRSRPKSDFVVLPTEPFTPDKQEETHNDVEEPDDMKGISLDAFSDEQEEPSAVEYVVTNVFATDAPAWDEEYEASFRVEGEPYVISVDTFMANENDWAQETLTYYQGDDILADQADTPVYGFASLMGELKFGHGSNDPNVVYIRNPVQRREWEILLHTGRFEFEVAGLSMENEIEANELKHSYSRKFRDD